MSPEAKVVVKNVFDTLNKRTGLDSQFSKDLQEKAHQALNDGDYQSASIYSKRLDTLKNLPEELKKHADEILKTLKKYGIDKEDIGWNEIAAADKPREIEGDVAVHQESKPGKKSKSELYLDDYKFVGLLGIVKKDEEGKFTNLKINEVVEEVLVPDKRNDENRLKARSLLEFIRNHEANKIRGDAARKGASTMEELYLPRFNESKGVVSEYYAYVCENYSEISPHEFAENVLKRRFERKNKPSVEKSMPAVETKLNTGIDVKELFTAGDMPGVEMVLSGKFRKTVVIDAIKHDLFKGRDFFQAAEKMGWHVRENPIEVLEESSMKAHDKRGTNVPDNHEQSNLDKTIRTVIVPILTSDTENRRVLLEEIYDSDYEALKLLGIITEVASELKISDLMGKLNNALYKKNPPQDLPATINYDK